MTRRMLHGLLVVLAMALALGACAPAAPPTPAPAKKEFTFYIVSHGGPADPFWGVVIKGMNEAAQRYPVEAKYFGPEKFSIQELVNLLNSAIAAKPDGLAVTITDPKALDEPLRRAIQQGIPVIAINVADPRPEGERIPYLFYIGMDEYLGGLRAAQRMLAVRTPKRAVCAIHEVGHVGLEARCQGFLDGMKEKNVPVEKLDIGTDPTKAVEALKAYFTRNPDTDALLTLGPLGTDPAVKFLKENNLVGKVLHGTFDLHPGTLSAIQEGVTLFAIDQQQYLQGYMAVTWLYLYKKYGLRPANDVLTGPSFVDKDNVGLVEALIKAGIR
ncbi:sugar ABC transporter substrate-binding protein [Thermoflexus sp.]|uniref:sugar ABC transporter substrate-binding protein n=1 Tax=Thermoflexus sp. TaxID=1969742 RepID=UPI00331A8868